MTLMIRSACLQGYVPLALSAGLAPYEMLETAGIRRAWLLQPDIKFATDSFRRLIAASVQASGWCDFGLRLAASRSTSIWGPVALLIREQPSARMGFEVIAKYINLHAESLKVRIEERDQCTRILVDFLVSNSSRSPSAAVELGIGTIYQVIKPLLPENSKPLSVHFVHDAPEKTSFYRDFFGSPVHFNSEFDGLVFSSDSMDARRSADEAIAAYAQQIVSLLDPRQTDNFSDQVNELIVKLLPTGNFRLQNIADLLGLNVRTVRRRLLNENTSYETLLNQTREHQAIRHMHSDRSFSEISLVLGFSSGSRFSHWFREKFECTPRDWRSSLK